MAGARRVRRRSACAPRRAGPGPPAADRAERRTRLAPAMTTLARRDRALRPRRANRGRGRRNRTRARDWCGQQASRAGDNHATAVFARRALERNLPAARAGRAGRHQAARGRGDRARPADTDGHLCLQDQDGAKKKKKNGLCRSEPHPRFLRGAASLRVGEPTGFAGASRRGDVGPSRVPASLSVGEPTGFARSEPVAGGVWDPPGSHVIDRHEIESNVVAQPGGARMVYSEEITISGPANAERALRRARARAANRRCAGGAAWLRSAAPESLLSRELGGDGPPRVRHDRVRAPGPSYFERRTHRDRGAAASDRRAWDG